MYKEVLAPLVNAHLGKCSCSVDCIHKKAKSKTGMSF